MMRRPRELAGRQSGQTYDAAESLVVIYSYGDFHAATKVVRSDDPGAKLEIDRDSCVPANKVAAFFQKSLRRSRRRAHRAVEN